MLRPPNRWGQWHLPSDPSPGAITDCLSVSPKLVCLVCVSIVESSYVSCEDIEYAEVLSRHISNSHISEQKLTRLPRRHRQKHATQFSEKQLPPLSTSWGLRVLYILCMHLYDTLKVRLLQLMQQHLNWLIFYWFSGRISMMWNCRIRA